jgi:formate/nitrite transporter FocA (FNT family)
MERIPYGLNSLLKGLIFTVGLVLVIVAGAELFTGNALMILAVLSKKITSGRCCATGVSSTLATDWRAHSRLIMFMAKQYTFAGGAIGKTALTVANAKSGLTFTSALGLGIMCNILVDLAVWMTFSAAPPRAKSPPSSSQSVHSSPGFEHSIANMYFIPSGVHQSV